MFLVLPLQLLVQTLPTQVRRYLTNLLYFWLCLRVWPKLWAQFVLDLLLKACVRILHSYREWEIEVSVSSSAY